MLYNENQILDIWDTCVKNKIQQKKDEWLYVLNLLNERDKKENVLEIGCYNGGSTMGLKYFAKKMVTVDTIPKPLFSIDDLKDLDYTYVGSNSHDPQTFLRVKEILNEINVLFIDGDHTHQGVRKDFEIYSQLLVKGESIVIFHDIVDSEHHRSQGCTVSYFWNEIKDNYRFDEIIKPEEIWGGIGILYF